MNNKCCICGKEFTEFGNNPYPVKKNGSCCNCCNSLVVIPARLKLANEKQNQVNRKVSNNYNQKRG